MKNDRKLNVAVIGTVGIPSKYGGFETLVEHLVENKGNEFGFLVYCSKKAYPNGAERKVNASLKYLPLNANGIQSIVYDIWSIIHSIRKVDALLILGVSGCIILPLVKIFTNKKIIVNIDGMEWKREKWGKFAKSFLKFSEMIAVKYSDSVIADNKVIQEYVYKTYDKSAHLIAYGGDHTNQEKLTSETVSEFPFLSSPYAFKVCRIEPENNIELILSAFSDYKELNLIIVGNWSVSDYSIKLRERFLSYSNIFLLDPIYDQNKLNQIRSNCFLYVHGHSAGGTNPSLVEAMSLKLPILAFGINYNIETTGKKAHYFHSADSLLILLETLNVESLNKNSNEMYRIAEAEYSWKNIANKYANLFKIN